MANLGVIAGIIFLAVEIRQSNQIAIAANEITIRENYGSVNELIAGNRDISRILNKARDADTMLTDTDREMAAGFVARMFNIWFAGERAYDLGMASRAALDIALDDLHWHYDTYPGLRFAIREHVGASSANTQTEVNQVAAELLGNP